MGQAAASSAAAPLSAQPAEPAAPSYDPGHPSLAGFRKRAAAELLAVADAGAGGFSPTTFEHKLSAASDDSLEEVFGAADGTAPADRAKCEEGIKHESKEVLDEVRDIDEHFRERQRLKAGRADLLAVGFQTTGAENQEFASLIVCATAGIFAVSIHWSFFSIFGVAYVLYRRSTKQTREQRASVEDLQGFVEALREVEAAEQLRRDALRGKAQAWKDGRAA